MKNKKFSGIFAFLLCVCLALATLPLGFANAAEGSGTSPVVSVRAAVDYKVKELGFESDELKNEDLSVKKNGTDVTKLVGDAVDAEAAAKCWVTVTKKDNVEYVTKITFDYTKELFEGDDSYFDEYLLTYGGVEITVKVFAKETDVDRLILKTDASVLDAVKSGIEKDADGNVKLNSDDKVVLPSEIWNLLDTDSTIYSVDKLTAKVFVKTPGSSWTSSSSASGKNSADLKLTPSNGGTYYFYVLFSDPDGNTTEKDSDLVEKFDGFHDPDTDALVIPVFSFVYRKDGAPTVTLSSSNKTQKGIIGQSNSAVSYTVSGAAANGKEFVLKFRANGSNDWVVAEAGKHADFDADSFTASSLKFTPLQMGSFSFEVKARTADGTEETILNAGDSANAVIVVKDKVEAVKLVNTKFTDFLKNNWKSLIFLGIAVLCLIAIVVILLWKPKDKTAAEVASVEDDVKTEDASDIAVNADDSSKTEDAADIDAENLDASVADAPVAESADANVVDAPVVESAEAPVDAVAAPVAESEDVAPVDADAPSVE